MVKRRGVRGPRSSPTGSIRGGQHIRKPPTRRKQVGGRPKRKGRKTRGPGKLRGR